MAIDIETAISRARGHFGDDHQGAQGSVPVDAWVEFAQAEWDDAWAKQIRSSDVPPLAAIKDVTADGSANYEINSVSGSPVGVMCVMWVAEVVGGGLRYLRPAQTADGPVPFGDGQTGVPTHFAVYGHETAGVTLEMHPLPSSGTYRLALITAPGVLVDPDATPVAGETQTITGLSRPAENRLCLGMAERALVRAGQYSPGLEKLIERADAEVTFHAARRNGQGSPRVKNRDWFNRRWPRRGQDLTLGATPGTEDWWWL